MRIKIFTCILCEIPSLRTCQSFGGPKSFGTPPSLGSWGENSQTEIPTSFPLKGFVNQRTKKSITFPFSTGVLYTLSHCPPQLQHCILAPLEVCKRGTCPAVHLFAPLPISLHPFHFAHTLPNCLHICNTLSSIFIVFDFVLFLLAFANWKYHIWGI